MTIDNKIRDEKLQYGINPIQDRRRGQKGLLPISSSPVTSTNVGIGPQNFLTFSYNPFFTLV